MPTKLSTFVARPATSNTASHYYVETNDDGLVRPKALAAVRSEIVTTGTLGTGTANTSTFLRGDRTWSEPPTRPTATGGGSDSVFFENDQTVTTSYSIPINKNALSSGPITINAGATVTVPTGSAWTVV